MPERTVRIAAVADLHHGRTGPHEVSTLLPQVVAAQADVLVLAGDLTDYGLPEEAQSLARNLTAGVKIPIVAVLGNHDFHSGKADDVARILSEAGVHLLDGDSKEVAGIGFAGVKGFAGGYGSHALAPWGEEIVKAFVREALEEALKLESALARLRTERKVAVLHYAPVLATVEGEPLEILTYMGSGRLEEPLSRYPVDAVVHGHAHHGTPDGATAGGIPVYNVALSLLRRTYPDRPPFRLLEIPVVS